MCTDKYLTANTILNGEPLNDFLPAPQDQGMDVHTHYFYGGSSQGKKEKKEKRKKSHPDWKGISKMVSLWRCHGLT